MSRLRVINFHTKDQYEALGYFIVQFESMIAVVRDYCIELLAKGQQSRSLMEIAFHHYALSAKPLYDIFRAVVAEILNPPNISQLEMGMRAPTTESKPEIKFDVADRNAFAAVIKRISAEYIALAEIRNDLIHATWNIGYLDDNPRAEEFHVSKYETTKSGLSAVEGLPKTADDLRSLAQRCEDTREWLGCLYHCLIGRDSIRERFVHERGDWFLVWGQSKRPLPRI